MGKTHHAGSEGQRQSSSVPSARKRKRSLQHLVALLVLAVPVSFLAFGGQWLAAAGLGPAEGSQAAATGSSAPPTQEDTAADARQAALEAVASERAAAMAIDVPDYVPTGQMETISGQTVVSITFDDGFSGQVRAAEILAEYEFRGTFFLNSGLLDEPGSLTLRQAKQVALAGHEIGGHTFSHPNIKNLDIDEATREICQDRENLLSMGFEVTNFAYPFASTDDTLSVVENCGYNSARGLGGTTGPLCVDCPPVESIPPADPYLLKAPEQVEYDWTLADLQAAVSAAQGTGGWVLLTFHGMCPYECESIDIDESVFLEFVDWLSARTADGSTVVRTVQEVLGGPMPEPVKGPQAQPVPLGQNALRNSDIEQWNGDRPVCWMQAGYGTNDAEMGKAIGNRGTSGLGVTVRSHEDGDAKFVATQDLGTCAPAVTPGRSYSLRLWYLSDAKTQFSVQYRDASGEWHFWTASPLLEPSRDFAPAEWTTPPVPAGATALSFGLSLATEGYAVTDDYGLYDAEGAPPVPAAVPASVIGPATLPQSRAG